MSARPLDSRHPCADPERFEARASFPSSGLGPLPASSPESELLRLNPQGPETFTVPQCGDGGDFREPDPSYVGKVETPSPEVDDLSRKPRRADPGRAAGAVKSGLRQAQASPRIPSIKGEAQ